MRFILFLNFVHTNFSKFIHNSAQQLNSTMENRRLGIVATSKYDVVIFTHKFMSRISPNILFRSFFLLMDNIQNTYSFDLILVGP